jgi:hypothetical protein
MSPYSPPVLSSLFASMLRVSGCGKGVEIICNPKIMLYLRTSILQIFYQLHKLCTIEWDQNMILKVCCVQERNKVGVTIF